MQKFMAFCLLVSFLVFPVSATGSEYVSRDTFWNWAAGSNGVIKQVINFVGGLGTCSKSDDTYHHASSYFKEGNVDGEVRYRCICDLCGDAFTAYKSDLQQSYEDQVAELPAQNYDSDGRLRFRININNAEPSTGVSLISFEGGSSFNATWVLSGSTSGYPSRLHINIDEFKAPISGDYHLAVYFTSSCSSSRFDPASSSGSYSYFFSGYSSLSQFRSDDVKLNQYYEFSTVRGFPAGARIFPGTFFLLTNCSSVITYSSGYLELICTPAIFPGDTYNINSRPTSITGDYGIIGDNGQIIKVEGDKIVNETNNTYYNPATGETTTITDWSYNYEDRSYTVTTETGDTITITYGDENVVIKEGDTTYNIYYLVNGSGSENPGPDIPDVCDHAWTETSRTDPTCSTAGKVSSVCSKCGQVKTEPLPATGHTWVVDRTVQTTYDEEGNLLQQGYTIYSCSVCGEQYKDMEGTGPPGAEEEKSIWEKIGDLLGSGFSGIIEIIEAILSKILDALTSLVDMLMDKLKHIVESVLSIFDELPALFGGFLDFLAAIFPFLPPEITTILTFGVIAITFIGILKAVRR